MGRHLAQSTALIITDLTDRIVVTPVNTNIAFMGFFWRGGGIMHWSVWFSRKIQIQRTI